MEPSGVVKDPRLPEIAWLLVIGVLIALGTAPVLRFLALNRVAGALVLVVVIVGTIVMIRRAYDPASTTVRADVTKGVAYCVAAVLALITVVWHPHWAIRACITAAEVAIVFDIVTIAARPRAAREH
ncbi:MAG: hypothetical protein NVS3B7_20510 [Candidatus Elarobacter sp.]